MLLLSSMKHRVLWITIVILGITTVGVVKTLLKKRAIQCACLGSVLKLPMTEATFIENAIMLVMAWGSMRRVWYDAFTPNFYWTFFSQEAMT